MKILPLILSLLICSQLFSQKVVKEFGVISLDEIKMNSYEKDKEAKAVVLYDKGKSIFYDTKGGYDIRFTRHKRIKIFDNSESQYAEVSIPYYVDGFGKTEVVKSIKAVSYNYINGVLVEKELDPKTIYEEQISERWFNKKFVFPDVQDGSILEYSYILESPFHFNLPDWYFQDEIPTIYSEYEVSLIPFYEYVYIVQGVKQFDYSNSIVAKEKRTWGSTSKSYGKIAGNGAEFQDYVHSYVLKDVPAFDSEDYITSVNDYIIKMDWQLAKFHDPRGGTIDIISTWPSLNEELLKSEKFGKYMKSCSRYAEQLLKDLPLQGLDEIEKAQIIIDYVKNNFEWNGTTSKYSYQSVKNLLNNKSGNAADINLFMIEMLNAANINAVPLILSTRNHGKIRKQYPFDHYTNYVIALVNTPAPFLADATEELLPYNIIPTRCLNGEGILVDDAEEPTWISLESSLVSVEKNVILLSVDTSTLDIKTRVSIQGTLYESFSSRTRFKDDRQKIKEYYSDKIGVINNMSTYGYKSISKPYSLYFEGSFETEKIGENIVVKPFLNLPISKNPLSQKTRNYPVDFVYPYEEQFESTLEIPDGFTIATLPESYSFDNELVEVNINYTISNGTLSAKGNYKFKKAIYDVDEYTKLKFYFKQIVEYFNQPVVLELNS